MNREELKNEILFLLKDIFVFGFHYDEKTNKFISNYDGYDDYSDIDVDKDGINFYIGCKDGYDNGYCYNSYISFDKMAKLHKYIKEFYK